MEAPLPVSASDASPDGLWQRFAASRSPELRARLIGHYLPFARKIAAWVYRVRFADGTPFEDYLQYGRVGLIEAVDRFSAERGVSFESFASHRVRGAILNGIAHATERAARRTKRQGSLEERTASLTDGWRDDPSEASLEDFAGLAASLGMGLLLDAEAIEDQSAAASPYGMAELSQLRDAVRAAVLQLPEREQGILELHYFRQVAFRDIAAMMSITKGRVSQLHARALGMLRAALASHSAIDRRL